MRAALLAPVLITAALAQSNNTTPSINTTALEGLANALNQAGLGQLASAAASIINTTAGSQLLSALTDTSKNFTIFAPTDAAFGKVDNSTGADQIADILSYHVLPGGFANSTFFANSPNHSVIRTFLNDSASVSLEGNLSQPLVFEVVDNKTITILNQDPTANVTNTTHFGNYTIHTIDSVLKPPGSLATLLKSSGFSGLSSALDLANLTTALEQAHGFTLFAPSSDALQNALNSFGANATNATLLGIVFGNHVINGTSVYSTEFGSQFTSASGESLKFNQTNGTWAVSSGSSGNFTAHITQADILVQNGVVHIIDNVLANTANDSGAASSAFSSATSAAASSSSNSPGGAVGTTPAGAPAPTKGAATALSALPAGLHAVFAAVVAIAFGACLL